MLFQPQNETQFRSGAETSITRQPMPSQQEVVIEERGLHPNSEKYLEYEVSQEMLLGKPLTKTVHPGQA